MTLKCTGCGKISKNEKDIRFCECGSLMFPEEKPEAEKPRKEVNDGGL